MPTGRLGVVADVRFSSRVDRPDELVIRGGLFGSRVVVIPVSEIVDVLPREERIILGSNRGRHGIGRLSRPWLRAQPVAPPRGVGSDSRV